MDFIRLYYARYAFVFAFLALDFLNMFYIVYQIFQNYTEYDGRYHNFTSKKRYLFFVLLFRKLYHIFPKIGHKSYAFH